MPPPFWYSSDTILAPNRARVHWNGAVAPVVARIPSPRFSSDVMISICRSTARSAELMSPAVIVARSRSSGFTPTRPLGVEVSGSSRQVNHSVSTPAADSTTKIARQPQCDDTAPPTIGARPGPIMIIRFKRASWRTAGAEATPSATESLPASAWSSVWPWPNARPTLMLRDCGLEQVSTRSPRPQRPATVSASPPSATAMRVISEKPRVISAACAERPRPRPSTMPQPMASTFFTAPPASAPTMSVAK